MNRNRFPWIMLIAALALAGCTNASKDVEEAEEAAEGASATTVTLTRQAVREAALTLATAELRALEGSISVPATLLPNQDFEAQVGSLVEGRVKKVFVNVGDVVRAGQELMHIEGLEVGEIKSNFIKARAHLEFAQANFNRQKTLLEQKVGSQKVWLESKAELDKANAEFDAEDKRIHSIGLSDADVLKYVAREPEEANGHIGGVLPIRAPIAGTVVDRAIVIGQLVDASTLAFRIVNTSTLWAEGRVHEASIPLLRGKPAIGFTATAFPGELFPGTLFYIAPVIDERTRTMTIRATIPNRDGRLKPQMFGELRVPVGGGAQALVIPEESVQKDGGTCFVFAATNDTTFERRTIVPGVTAGGMVEVREGLTAGMRVVVKGAFQLKSEMMKHSFGEEE